jgi:hypothetical protein
MGDWLVQIVKPEDLKKLSAGDIEILKAEIRKQLRENTDIKNALNQTVGPLVKQLVPRS